ncbi:tyrosine-type recombinase/integrase [Aminobacter sp. SR38]|jgi:integrase|uniref:tyrosine-type recombinase/integrase n=1 Tax=Aminobacter sp. SR38 TaxID=2774562 RepID=UPI00177DDE38|nr:site-specific integrase [Aminobacter sp. SR38]QOF71421.1 tyrosine-type recombinase/integrase [Aminobacter sp. SR38]
MARETFTDKRLKALRAAETGKRYDLQDAIVPGLGVRVTDKGTVTFTLTTRFPGSTNPTRRALGEYGALTLDQARDKAREWIALIKKGVDPAKAEQETRDAAERATKAKRERAFETVLAEFIKARKRDGVKKWKEDEADFQRECLPRWKGRAVEDITMSDILEVLEAINTRGKQRQSLNIGQKIGTFFSYCVDVELLDTSPYRPKRVSKVIGTKQIRERVLTPVEIAAFWKATDKLHAAMRDAYRMLLLTGARLNEACKLQWTEVDFERERIVLEADRTKQGRAHVIPMTTMVRELLEGHKSNLRPVFISPLKNAVTINAKDKAALDKGMLAALRENDPAASLPDWVNHDLRRTVQTNMGDLEITDDVIHAVVGHKTDRLTQTYNKSERLTEKRAALEAWERRLREIVGLPPLHVGDNVVPLKATA